MQDVCLIVAAMTPLSSTTSSGQQRLTHRLVLRVEPSDAERIELAARADGRSVASWLRQAALTRLAHGSRPNPFVRSARL